MVAKPGGTGALTLVQAVLKALSHNGWERARQWGAIIFGLLLIAAVVQLQFDSVKQLSDWNRAYQKSLGVSLTVQSLFSSLIDAETGQRGYLLTGDPAYLEPYLQAPEKIDRDVKKLKALMADDPSQLAKLKVCLPLIAAKRSELQRSISVRREEGLAPALEIVRSDVGKRLMDQIRWQVQLMLAEEDRRCAQTYETIQSSTGQATWQTAAATICASIIILSLFISLMAQSRNLNSDLTAKIGELAAANEELIEAKSKAQESSKLKSEFLANMSHEIRTPMHGITGMCEALASTSLSARQREQLNTIKDAGVSLLTVLNDILDLSKIEAGQLELRCIDFNIVDTVESVCQVFVTPAQNREISLVSFIDTAMPQLLRGDPDRISQVLLNLTSNAIKFSSHEEVVVRASLDSVQDNVANVRFSVTDRGIGLSEEDQVKVFEPFIQADGSATRKFGGTGLGLSIASRLVSLMGGTIGVQSTRGVGSTFWFVIPHEIRSDVPLVSEKDELQGSRALIVDDEPGAREAMCSYIAACGMREESAKGMQEAVRILQQGYADDDPFALALIDYAMPGRNGMELARQIQADAALKGTGLILLTADRSDEHKKQAIDTGFRGLVMKPVRLFELMSCVAQVAGGGKPIHFAADLQGGQAPHEEASALVLVADDHPLNQEVVKFFLEEIGVPCHIVSNGREAVEAVRKHSYSLVLMDCQMPQMDGFEATATIRGAEDGRGSRLPIIAMTAHAMSGDREKCLQAGMDDYLAKPFEAEELQRIIVKWIPRC